MKGRSIVVAAATQLYAPLLVLFGATLLADYAPGGVGFVAGLTFGLALALVALTFGAGVARQVLPPAVARAALGFGVLAVIGAVGLPELAFAPQVEEAGLCAATAAAVSLTLFCAFERAPTLSDAEW